MYDESLALRAPGGVEVVHHTGAHGKRYQVDRAHRQLLDGLVDDGKQRIARWIRALDGGAHGRADEFLEDRFDGEGDAAEPDRRLAPSVAFGGRVAARLPHRPESERGREEIAPHL